MRNYWKAYVGIAAVLGGLLAVGEPASANGCGIPYDLGTNTYSISLPIHFTYLATCTSTATFNVITDIDLSGITIATRTNFTGVFDGNGYTISNLSITGSGMFDVPAGGATFREINFVSSSVSGGPGANGWAGALVHEALGPVTITNSSFQGTVTSGAGANSWAGGFIGEARGNVTITDSYVKGSVLGGSGGNAYVGGFVGQAASNPDTTLSFRRNYMTGSITGGSGTSAWAGGFFGKFGFYGLGTRIIENSFVRATVTSGAGVGATANGYVGDGTSGEFTLNKSYFEGTLTDNGLNPAQPILGSGTVTHSSVFCVATCGTATIGTAKATLALLKSSVAADSWDFANTWCYSYGHNDGYPVLKWLTFGPNAAWGDCIAEPAPPPPPETTTTTTPTTTTTSTTMWCQAAPVQVAGSGSVLKLQPGESHIERGGVVVKSGVRASATVIENSLHVSERGVAPNSSVDVWLVGGREFLGTLTADLAGAVHGSLTLPNEAGSRVNTLQMVERNCNSVGYVVSLGLSLPASATLPGTGNRLSPITWLMGVLAIAVGSLLRRKRVA